MNRTKATATQNSASFKNDIGSSALEHVRDDGLDLAAWRGRTDQSLDDGGRGIGGDAPHIGHGSRLALGDRPLGIGAPCIKLGIERLACCLRLSPFPLAGLIVP